MPGYLQRHMVCYIMPAKDLVTFGFCGGEALANPKGLIEGSGKSMRHVKNRTLEEARKRRPPSAPEGGRAARCSLTTVRFGGVPEFDKRDLFVHKPLGSRSHSRGGSLDRADSGTMSGRVCIVTGANSGIGKATAHGLASMGATVVLACRSRERGAAARAEIHAATGNSNLRVMELDLARQASVRAFAKALVETHRDVHVLVNNAGIYTAKRRLTADGIESTFAVDYLSHFLLTKLLLDALKASAPSRIVNVTSEASQMGRMDFDDLNGERRWSGMRAYAQSKLAQVLFTKELARRLAGTQVTANCVHPGGVPTKWSRGGGLMRMGYWLAWPFLLTLAEGADTVVYVASSPDVEEVTGTYLIKRRPATPNPVASDEGTARRPWEVSEALILPRPPGR